MTAVDGRAPEMDCALVRRQWRFDKSTSADQEAIDVLFDVWRLEAGEGWFN